MCFNTNKYIILLFVNTIIIFLKNIAQKGLFYTKTAFYLQLLKYLEI